ncbi:hypothetical protein ACT2FY_38730 [Paraburkholderia fungorum]|uniref:hypothetical protein n=1 Tax=Paraburkholderia fungorum TaxID=134537 RepID=UPI00402B86E4
MTKVEELVQSQLPPNSDWAKPTANLARAMLLRALEMPLPELREFIKGVPGGFALSMADENTLAAMAKLVQITLVSDSAPASLVSVGDVDPPEYVTAKCEAFSLRTSITPS